MDALAHSHRKPVVHISLNPDPEDRLSDDELTDIAAEYMEGMGWGGQPYVVYKHTDIDRPHIHIVTVQVDSSGRKIGDKALCLHTLADRDDLPGSVHTDDRYERLSTERSDCRLSFAAPVGLLLSCNHIYNRCV